MPRGRRQYYDPEVQLSRPVEGDKDLSRIEFYPELDGSGQIGRWVGRRNGQDGRIVGYTAGNFDRDRELAHAQELWPGLEVFELNDEQADSTWEGTGPSPRIWQNSIIASEQAFVEDTIANVEAPEQQTEHVFSSSFDKVPPEPIEEQMPLHIVVAGQPGTYVLLDDVIQLLLSWAEEFERNKNPSAALGLNEAVQALKDIG